MFPLAAVAVLGFLVTSLVAPAEAGPPRQHAAHVHGHGRLDVVLDSGVLQAELTAPGADLVGFEHPPHDAAQRQAVESAVAVLRDGARMLGLPTTAACRQDAVDVDRATLSDGEDHDDAHHDDHGTSGESHAGDEHAEFRIGYRFTCEHPDRLDQMAIGYFAAFERANELAVQAVGPWGQTSRTLTRAAPRLTFR